MSVRRTLPLLALLVIGVPLLGRGAQDSKKPGSRAELMRQKLELSKHALEGLTRGDFDTVAGIAKKLKVLSENAQWENPPPPDKKQYRFFLENFKRNCDDLGTKARAKDLEGSTFAYVHLTVNCIECHKLVRDQVDPAVKK